MIIQYSVFLNISVWYSYQTAAIWCEGEQGPSTCLWIVPGTIDPLED